MKKLVIPNLPPLKIHREPAPKKPPKPPKPPRPPPKPKPAPSAENLYALMALHARVKESTPRAIPSVQQLLNKHTIEGAFGDLRRRVTRRFELWVPDARGDLICINPIVAPSEAAILNPPQRAGERQLLSVDVDTHVFVPAHRRLVNPIDGEMADVPASYVHDSKIAWLKKDEVARLRAPYEYVVVRVVA